MAKNIKLTENNAKKSPQGGVLVGKKDGQTIIYDDGKVGGWFVGKTHKEGGIQGIDKTTGQPIEVQTGEVIITAPALADQTPREFQGKMLTNRQILSKINSDAGGVAFAEDGMEIPSKILFKGGSYKYGGKMMSDKEIADEINKCGCDHDEKYDEGGNIMSKKEKQEVINSRNSIYEIPQFKLSNDGKNVLKLDARTNRYKTYDSFDAFFNSIKNIKASSIANENSKKVFDYLEKNGAELYNKSIYGSRYYDYKGKNIRVSNHYNRSELTDEYGVKKHKEIKSFFSDEEDGWKEMINEIENFINKEKFNNGGHLSEGISLEDIAKKHGVTLEELDKQVEIGMEDESIHAGDYKDHFNIVKDHLVESPTFYTDEQKAQGKNEKFVKGGELEIGGNYRIKNNFGSFSTIKIMPIDENLRTSKDFFSVEVTVRAKDGDNIKIRKNPLTTYPISKYNSFMEDLEKRNPIKFNKGGEMKKENLVKDAKDGNTPARDLNNYNDMLDVQADGQVGGDSGIYKDGGAVGNKKEYEYILTQRPFDIGTYPKENFIRFEQQKYRFGVVIYSKPISIREIEHFSLCPITEIKDFNNKFLYYLVSDTKQKIQIKLIPDERIGYFVDIIYYDGDKVEDTQMISAVKFLKRIQEGDYKIENEIKDEPKKEKEVSKKEKSFESEGSTEGKGKLYEFFTPQIVADKMLALAQHYGFKGGNVLEPATGSGRLIKNLKNTNITAFEISKDNFEILKREFPNAELYNFNFEKAFLKEPRFNTLLNRKGTETWLKNAPFDLVLANPPYGKFSGLYSSYFKFKGQVEHFFILQTLHLLKKGGLGVYLIPSSFMRNGIAYNDIKKEIFEIAELVDAYRLPSNIFEKTQIGTDILILRKK